MNDTINALATESNNIIGNLGNNENSEIYGDDIWINDYKILFTKDNLSKFVPTVNMTNIEKLNAIMRLSIYLGIALCLFTGKTEYLLIIILIGLLTYFIYKYQENNMELFFNSYNNSNFNKIQKSLMKKPSNIEPTVDNPFMNIDLIGDIKTKEAAPPSWNNENIKENIEDKYNYNLYRDVGDLYGKSNSQRQFYTMPSTTIPNNQTSFAKWCYSTGPTCKETSIYCAPQMNPVPYLDNTNVTKDNNQLL
jgi:hypothetical protein